MTTHNPLDVLLADGVIDEIVGRLKSGKEADIYLVRHAGAIVAAKVYKDRAQRSFKNNSDYKEGRGERSSRTRRAIETGSKFGREASEQAWRTTESDALHRLHANGVRVPTPVLFYEGVLLMHLVTDAEGRPAPRLIDTAYDAEQARALYIDLRAQIVRILCCELIHGDLSPYNILAAEAGATIIDFPQVVSPAHSSRSEFFFQRDFQNVLEYVGASDRTLLAFGEDGRKIWQAYVRRDLTPDFVPSPPSPPRVHAPRPQVQPQARPQPQVQQARPQPQARPQVQQARPQPQQARPPQQHPARVPQPQQARPPQQHPARVPQPQQPRPQQPQQVRPPQQPPQQQPRVQQPQQARPPQQHPARVQQRPQQPQQQRPQQPQQPQQQRPQPPPPRPHAHPPARPPSSPQPQREAAGAPGAPLPPDGGGPRRRRRRRR